MPREGDEPRLVWCDRCNGLGVVDCRCGGDLCVCSNHGERTCRQCGGDGEYVQGDDDAE